MSAPDNFSFDLPDFCKNCKYFEAEVLEGGYYVDSKWRPTYTVTCQHKESCSITQHHLEENRQQT